MNALFSVGPHAGAHRVALRASVSVLVPLLVLFSIGHIEWSIYAAFGAFTSVYGRSVAHGARLQMQSTAAVILIGSVMLGTVVALLPEPQWVVVPVAAVWAMVAALASDTARWAPPGPLFAVFALCSVGSIPATPGSLLLAFTVAASAAAFALVLGQLGRLRPSARRRRLDSPSASPGSPDYHPRTLLGVLREPGELLHISRFGIAAAAAGALSTAFGIGHPYWAMVAAIVPLVAIDFSNSLLRATHRILGTAAGLVLAGLLLLLEPSGLWAILLAAALQALAELFVARNYALALLFVTPLALIMVTLAHPTPTAPLLADRAIETLLGTLVALAVALATLLASRRADRITGRSSADPA